MDEKSLKIENEIKELHKLLDDSVGKYISIYNSILICQNLSKIENLTENELLVAGNAIKNVMDMPTHNSVTKKDMLNIIKFLWHQIYEYEEVSNDT